MKKISLILSLIKKGEIRFLVNGITKRVYSKVYSLGLKRDLMIDFPIADSLVDIKIRLATTDDNSFFEVDNFNIGLFEKNIPSCYVAVDKNNAPCFRVWLMDSSQNDKIQSFFKNIFPILKENEALVESVFTIPKYRGKRIMPAILSRIAKKEVEVDARYLIAFVGSNNTQSLKVFKRSGYYPFILRTESWFLFRNKVSFLELPEGLKRNFDLLN